MVFAEGTEVHARFETAVAYITYAYSLMSDSQKEVGVTAGVHWYQNDMKFESEATGQQVGSFASAPLPIVGVYGNIALGIRTSLGARLQFFRLDADHYNGRIDHAQLGIQHTFSNRFSVGAGYQLYDVRLESDHSRVNGETRVRHHGPFVFVGAHF